MALSLYEYIDKKTPLLRVFIKQHLKKKNIAAK